MAALACSPGCLLCKHAMCCSPPLQFFFNMILVALAAIMSLAALSSRAHKKQQKQREARRQAQALKLLEAPPPAPGALPPVFVMGAAGPVGTKVPEVTVPPASHEVAAVLDETQSAAQAHKTE